ncbi:hypothetical protein LJK88_32180 [Paenibacillus sp. P26]|nr:hypothetical protein LJK88_32180 [Paenibacillus sp. P26]UUZ94152.1 hypothetical protein LJK87_05905 [Paenibacillus sp. P25]
MPQGIVLTPNARQGSLKRRRLASQLFIVIVLSLGSVIMVIPLLWMLSTSFDWGPG